MAAKNLWGFHEELMPWDALESSRRLCAELIASIAKRRPSQKINLENPPRTPREALANIWRAGANAQP